MFLTERVQFRNTVMEGEVSLAMAYIDTAGDRRKLSYFADSIGRSLFEAVARLLAEGFLVVMEGRCMVWDFWREDYHQYITSMPTTWWDTAYEEAFDA